MAAVGGARGAPGPACCYVASILAGGARQTPMRARANGELNLRKSNAATRAGRRGARYRTIRLANSVPSASLAMAALASQLDGVMKGDWKHGPFGCFGDCGLDSATTKTGAFRPPPCSLASPSPLLLDDWPPRGVRA